MQVHQEFGSMLLNELESVYLKVLLFWSCSNYYPQEQSETDMCQESAFYEPPSPPTYMVFIQKS